MSTAKVTTFSIDPAMERSIEEIRNYLGASSNAEVFRRSIGLMKLAIDAADEKKRIEIRNGKDTNIVFQVPLA